MSGGSDRRGAAVLGRPIGHSLSPVLHRAAYSELGLEGWDYRAVDCGEAELLDTLRALDAEGLSGASLTMPLKRAVLPMLTSAEALVETVGAANTVLFGSVAGDWHGANTDVPGMVAVLRAAGARPGEVARSGGAEVVVLGGGATAASVVSALGAVGFGSVCLVVRRPEAAAGLTALAAGSGISLRTRAWSEVESEPAEVTSSRLVVSTTPAGATDRLATRITRSDGLLIDVVYAPWPTPLARAWSDGGGRVVGGLDLLVEQAAEQVRLMTGRGPSVDLMREAGLRALGEPAGD